MSNATANFSGDIPRIYDLRLGPYIFEGYATDLAARAAAASPRDVLELAAGTGIVTRKLRQVLPAAANLTATDLNAPMLEVAREKISGGNVAFQQADACALPFQAENFDCVVCQFGVMFFPDKPLSYSHVARVLRPGGRYLFNVWCSLEDNPFGKVAHETIASFFAADPPSFYRTPFGYHDHSTIQAQLTEAGFSDVRIEESASQSEVDVGALLAQGLVYGNPVIAEINARGSSKPEAVADAVANALRRTFGVDPFKMPLKALVIEARR